MNKKRCIVCGAPLWDEPLLVCNNMPAAAQNLPSKEELENEKPINYNLYQCSGCGLVQIDVPPVDYYKDVKRSGGYSTTMYNLRCEQYTRFMESCPIENKKIIEIGCGQGEFLRVWREGGFKVDAYGIEHESGLVDIALKDGLKVERNYALDETVMLSGAPFDGFCSFNFMEHQPDPNGMLRCIFNNLKDDAWGLITVPSLEYILEKESYYELIRDHLLYFSKDAFKFLLEKNGFAVKSFRMVNRDTWEAIVEKKKPIDAKALRDNKTNLQKEIHDIVAPLKAEGKKLAVWGASHQGLTILSSMDFKGTVAYVIDSAPFKQGKYTASSHIKIVPSEYMKTEPVDTVFIIAPGYTDEISGIIKDKYDTDGKINIYALRGNSIEKIK